MGHIGPILKWAGGKRRLAPEIVGQIRCFNRYVEPMCGGAAVFWELFSDPFRGLVTGFEHFVLADANWHLMNFYRVLQDHPQEIATRVSQWSGFANNKSAYEALRHQFNSSRCENDDVVERAALFFYLNLTCFNGLWRVNKEGDFNVPFGHRKRLSVPTREAFDTYSSILRQVTLAHADLFGTLDAHPPQVGDCWYFDPPYDGTFTAYHEAWEGEESQRQVLETAKRVRDAGAQVLISNADTPFIRELWKGWEIAEISVNYSIRPHGDREEKGEVLISSHRLGYNQIVRKTGDKIMAAAKKKEKDTPFEGRFSGFNYDPDKLIIIGLDTEDGNEHPLYDERIELPVEDGMVVSIMAIGVKQTVTIARDGGQIVVVDGRQRVRAAREANERLRQLGDADALVLVPCKMEAGSEDHLMEVAVATNELRREDEIWVKAAKAQRMLARGRTEEEVQRAFGLKTKATVKNWMKLMELPPQVKKAIDKGALSPSAAVKLHGMERKEMLEQLKTLVDEHAQTGKKASKTKVEGKRNGKTPKGPSKPSKKALTETLDTLSGAEGPFMAGIRAGLMFSLGQDVPEISEALTSAAAAAEE